MFDMCNKFNPMQLKGYKGIQKLDMIKANKNIINLFEFCGNSYMYQNLSTEDQANTNEQMHHHNSDSYMLLEQYILDYLNSKL